MLTLLVLSILVAFWLQYRDPTVLSRALRAARGLSEQRLQLPWDPRLLPGPPARELARSTAPLPAPRTIHLARAEPEIEHAGVSTSEPDTNVLTPAEARKRRENYDAWLRAQGFERLNGR